MTYLNKMFQVGVGPSKKRVRRRNHPVKLYSEEISVQKRRRGVVAKKVKYQTGIHTSQIAFQPYTGHRWQIPSGIHATQSVIHKFHQFDHHDTLASIINKISPYSKKPFFLSTIYNPFITEWKPPKCVVSAIQSHIDRESNDYKRVRLLYMKLKTITEYMERLVHTWHIHKCMRNIKNTVDAVTLEIPTKPVYVINYKQRVSYVYEARSLIKTIENRLLLCDYMFPEPKEPVNMLSNEPFSYGQLLSIYGQCKAYGVFSWILDRYLACGSLARFELSFERELYSEAIKTFFKTDLNEVREVVTDFFYANSILSDTTNSKFLNLFTKTLTHSYAKKWVSVTRRYYLAKNIKDTIEMAKITVEIQSLVRQGKTVLV